MKVELENVKPMDIEKRSFEIITEELGDTPLLPGTELVVKRCIHTSADFDYAKNLCFSENAVEKAIQAIKDGACIVPIPRWQKQESINAPLQGMAVRFTALCQMRMWRRLRKKMVPLVPQPAWTRRPGWIKS